MKKNMYYQVVLRRKNLILEFLLTLFLGLASWPRLLLEVYIRKNPGERYFSFSSAISILVLLALFPYWLAKSANFYGHVTAESVVFKNLAWYVYLSGFLVMALKRRNEVKRLPSVFDFERFSLSSGIVNKQFYNFDFNGKRPNIRTIETILEPGLFLLIGIFLAFFGQTLGYLLMVCSIIYSLSYVAAYHIGDNFIMDKIDEMICNEEMVASFVDGRDPGETRGFNAYGRKPTDPDLRRRVANAFLGDDEPMEVF